MVSEEVLTNLPIIVNIWHRHCISKIRRHLQRKPRRWHRVCSKIIFIVPSQPPPKDESHCSRLSHYTQKLLDMDRVLKAWSLARCIISLSVPPPSAEDVRADVQQPAHSICGHSYQNFLCKTGPSVTSSPYSYLVLQSWTSQEKSNSTATWNFIWKYLQLVHHSGPSFLELPHVIPKERRNSMNAQPGEDLSRIYTLCFGFFKSLKRKNGFNFKGNRVSVSINSCRVYCQLRFLSLFWV